MAGLWHHAGSFGQRLGHRRHRVGDGQSSRKFHRAHFVVEGNGRRRGFVVQPLPMAATVSEPAECVMGLPLAGKRDPRRGGRPRILRVGGIPVPPVEKPIERQSGGRWRGGT